MKALYYSSASNCFTASTLYIRFNMIERDAMLLNPLLYHIWITKAYQFEHDQTLLKNLLHTDTSTFSELIS